MPLNRILFIDAYDSFSNSIISLLKSELSVTVDCVKIDDARFVLNDEALFLYLDGFDAVVAGPGPGHPSKPEDIGLIAKLWRLPDEHLLPVLGICLGFQSLGLAFGAQVERLKEPRHGILSMLTHLGKDIFADTGKIVATQYHSLHVQLEKDGKVSNFWEAATGCPDLLPLAWDLMNVSNGPVLMAVRHQQLPFWGVQYHPESICTNKQGQKLIGKWWEEVKNWQARRSRECDVPLAHDTTDAEIEPLTQNGRVSCQVHTRSFHPTKPLDVAALVDLLRVHDTDKEPLLLESGSRYGKSVNPETGRFSIVGLPGSSSAHIRYYTSTGLLEHSVDGHLLSREQAAVSEAFAALDEIVKSNTATNGPKELPFWGGLIGYISYEAGLETIGVHPSATRADRPDIWFVLVKRSIVIDHKERSVYLQSLDDNDGDWLDEVQRMLCEHFEKSEKTSTQPMATNSRATVLCEPQQKAYCQKVLTCQSQLRAGESYELCLTDQSIVSTPEAPWSMYRHLRLRNPAPFSAFLQLRSPIGPGLSIVGSSPERFLSWSRDGKCQFRPIKGTVKKVPGVTRAKAEEVLGSAKERAENLMIVDLIRHDLSGVKGISNVHVPKLMSVEEYETVYQLVSVVEGTLSSTATPSALAPSGLSVLAASLPPGSMTGAPKKRSCELLQEIENHRPRGLYSGVIGYLDVGGGGDFSVVIRTAFKWDDDEWRVGAGGAVTALSEAEGEWEEMMTKRESVFDSLL